MEEKKFSVKSLLGCFLPLLAGLGCQVVVSIIGSIIVGIIFGITGSEPENGLMIIMVLATLVTVIIGAVWYKKYRPDTELKRKEVVNGKMFAALACLGLSMQILISLCLGAITPLLPQSMTEDYSALMENLVGGNLLLTVIVTVVLAPLAEEFLFRGVTFRKAEKIMPYMMANIVQALMFGIYHMNPIQSVYAFVTGMVLGYTLKYFNSIWAAVLLHAFVNGSAQLLGLIPESIGESAFFAPGMAVAGVVLLLVAAKLFPQGRREQAA